MGHREHGLEIEDVARAEVGDARGGSLNGEGNHATNGT
jgi:hypothetical protein